MQFAPDSVFMKKLCGVAEGHSIEEVAHQIIWAKGLIGDKVGLSEGPKFDINAGTINQLILVRSLQEIMEMYYEDLELQHIIPLVKTAFDRLLTTDQKSRVTATNPKNASSIYSALQEIYETVKKRKPTEEFISYEEGQSWLVHEYAGEEDTVGGLSITLRGTARVMSHMGILDEITEPLL